MDLDCACCSFHEVEQSLRSTTFLQGAADQTSFVLSMCPTHACLPLADLVSKSKCGNVNSIYLIIGGGTPGVVRLHCGN